MRGHPRILVGDVLTELPTKLEVEREKKREGRKKKFIICPIQRGQAVGCRVLKNLLISRLAASK